MESLLRHHGQRFRVNFQHFLAIELGNGNVIRRQQVVFGIVSGEREGILIVERFIRHFFLT